MCLILLAWHAHPDYPLVVAANRDEFFARPTAPARYWEQSPGILAGRDLSAGGTWMGVTRRGRFAALTNFREPLLSRANAANLPSRGKLVSDFLAGDMPAQDYLAALLPVSSDYNGFNLVCGTLNQGLWHFSNRGAAARLLAPGIYGLSNHLLDTPWPKVAQGKSDLARALKALPADAPLLDLLRDDKIHEDDRLPRTGVNLEWERVLSAAFVRAPNYGTRSSTVLLHDSEGFVALDELTYLPGAEASSRNRFHFSLAERASS
jgi:uncharacterized protein with NRDE domain